MKIKVLLCLAVFIFAAQTSLAQDARLSAREKFEAWRQEKIFATGKSGQPFFYFVATAQKTEPEVAVINFGIAGFRGKLDVTVTPLKMEQTIDGKWIQTELPEAGGMQMSSGESAKTDTNFADSTMKILIDAEASALQVKFKFEGDTEAKTMTIKLLEMASTGRMTSL
jgi:hypothetical protein